MRKDLSYCLLGSFIAGGSILPMAVLLPQSIKRGRARRAPAERTTNAEETRPHSTASLDYLLLLAVLFAPGDFDAAGLASFSSAACACWPDCSGSFFTFGKIAAGNFA